MNKKAKALLPFGLVAIAIVGAIALVQARPVAVREERQVPAPLVRVMTVQERSIPVEVTSQGSVRARIDSTIAAEVAGRIQTVSPRFAAGGNFRRGEVLVQLDPRDYQVALSQAEAAVAQARLRVSRETAEAGIARQEWQSLGKGEPSELALRGPQLAEARAGLAAAEAAVAQARVNIERTSVRAPFDGILLDKLADLGQFVGPGAPIARLVASDYAEVELPVTSEDLAQIDLSASPAVTLRLQQGGGGGVWQGRIVRTSGQIDPQTRMLALIAVIDRPFTSGAQPLQIGQFVQARILGRTLDSVIEIPRAALRQGNRVLVLEGGDRLRSRPVVIARLTATTAVISEGLRSGDRIILSALEAPVDGMPVRVTEEPNIVPVREVP